MDSGEKEGAMTAGDFEHQNAARWAEYERLVTLIESGKAGAEAEDLPRRFRELSLDLSLAESRMYGGRIAERLNQLVIRGYNLIYQTRRGSWENIVSFVAVKFPQTVRREWRLFWLCSAVFWFPFFAMMLSANHDLSWAQATLGAEGMASMEEMYGGKEEQISHLRERFGSNFMMFCFYIQHNVGIDFQIFAGGMLAGIGTIFS
ncbi:MAG: hypothetical protein HC845_10440 [Akkermansiaceae bacterium]|nr:hypothetical protein [Akkermansiaceae bacterium]